MAGFRRFYDIRALVIDGNRVQGFGEVQASLKVIVSTLDSQTLKLYRVLLKRVIYALAVKSVLFGVVRFGFRASGIRGLLGGSWVVISGAISRVTLSY